MYQMGLIFFPNQLRFVLTCFLSPSLPPSSANCPPHPPPHPPALVEDISSVLRVHRSSVCVVRVHWGQVLASGLWFPSTPILGRIVPGLHALPSLRRGLWSKVAAESLPPGGTHQLRACGSQASAALSFTAPLFSFRP